MDTILAVKQEIEKLSNIGVKQQKMMYEGKTLKDNETLKYYEIYTGHSIFLSIIL